MRNARRLTILVMACAALAGCSDARQAKRQRMTEKIETARRLLNHATSLLADPQYLDKASGEVSPIYRRVSKDQLDVPASQPAEMGQALKLLDQAQALAEEALSEDEEAGPGMEARAKMLMGQIRLARAQYLSEQAEETRGKILRAQRRVSAYLEMLRDNASLAAFAELLSQIPKENVEKLKADAVQELDSLQKEMARIEGAVETLKQENEKLSAENEALLSQAMTLRQQSESGSHVQGLPLAQKARDVGIQAGAKSGRIAANDLGIETFQVDRSLLEDKLKIAQSKIEVFDLRAKDIDEANRRAQEAAKQARERAKKNWQEAEKAVGEFAKLARELQAREAPSLENFTAAGDRFDEAQTYVSQEIAAVAGEKRGTQVGQEVLKSLTDEERLATVVAWRGTAMLGKAELRARQWRVAANNAGLAQQIQESVKGLGTEGANQTAELLAKSYPMDPKVKDEAGQAYEAAEKQLDQAISHIADSQMRETQWIYQGQLASAYIGHYHLTGNRAVLDKAGDFVKKALERKEQSPYLGRVVELKSLIEKVDSGGEAPGPETETMPVEPGESGGNPATVPAAAPGTAPARDG